MGDIISFGSDKPRRRPSRLIVVGVIGLSTVALVVAAAFAFRDHGVPSVAATPVASPTAAPIGEPAAPPCLPVGWAQSPTVTNQLAALLIDRPRPAPARALIDVTAPQSTGRGLRWCADWTARWAAMEL